MKPTEETKSILLSYIDKAQKDGLFINKRVVVFGCNAFTKTIRDILIKYGITIDAILDNDLSKQGKLCLSIQVVNPQKYLNDNCDIAIIIYSSYWREMRKQTLEFGIPEEEMLIIPYKDVRQKSKPSLFCITRDLIDVALGYIYYLSICRRQHSKKVFICPYDGTGDVYIACGYLSTFVKKYCIDKFTIVTASTNCKNVIKLFFDEATSYVVPIKKRNQIIHAWSYWGNDIMDVKPLSFWGWRVRRTPWVFDNHEITFADMFRVDVFNLPESVPIVPPKFSVDKSFVEDLFSTMGLRKGRTIILAPYANSIEPNMEIWEWEEVTRRLSELGYDVCTNCAGEEKSINGTKRLSFPYIEAANVLEYAGGLIAIRSGLCDVISSVKCKSVIIYENGIRGLNYDYFGLKKMGMMELEIPVIYESPDDIDKIVEPWK